MCLVCTLHHTMEWVHANRAASKCLECFGFAPSHSRWVFAGEANKTIGNRTKQQPQKQKPYTTIQQLHNEPWKQIKLYDYVDWTDERRCVVVEIFFFFSCFFDSSSFAFALCYNQLNIWRYGSWSFWWWWCEQWLYICGDGVAGDDNGCRTT